MIDYQEIYNNLKEELLKLEHRLNEIQQNKNQIDNEYNELNTKLNLQKGALKSLNSKLNEMVVSNSKRNNIIRGIILFFYLSSMSYLLMSIIDKIGIALLAMGTSESLKIIFGLVYLGIGALVCGGGFFAVLVSGLIIADKFMKKSVEKTKNKLSNSQEYQDILKQINDLEVEVSLTKTKLEMKEKEKRIIAENYDICKEEISQIRGLINFAESKINPKEVSLCPTKKKNQKNS